METMAPGTRVTVAPDGPTMDGIIFDQPSSAKVKVAVLDRTRGPVFRTFAPAALTERTTDSPDDRALLLLIRRTAPAQRGASRGASAVAGNRAGFTRATMHRPTGK